VPIAHWVWGNGWLIHAGILDFAGGTVVHLNAGVAGLVAAFVVGRRYGYGSDNFAPYDLSLAWSGVGTFVLLKVIGLLVPLRVTKENEIEGLDVTQHGEALQ
jgi:ammonia channel protein AmtB